jgi:O-antigen/teichoic acid export membrane protein
MSVKLLRLKSTVAGYLKGSSLRRRLFSGSTWALGGKIGATALGVVTNGLLARMLSPQDFGAYFLAFSIVTLGALIGSLGLPKTVVRFVAEQTVLGHPGRSLMAVYTALKLGALGMAFVSLLYLLVGGDLIGEYLFHSPALVAVTGLIAGWMAISVMQEIMAEVFRGFHDIRMATLLGGLATGGKSGGLIMRALLLASLACMALMWSTSEQIYQTDLRTVMLASIGSGVASALLTVWFLRRRLSSLDDRGADNPISPKETLSDAFPTLIISLTSFILLSSADLWILGAFRPQAEVAIYGSAARLVALISMPLLITNLVLPPIIAEMYAEGRTARLERTVRSYSTLCGVPALLLLIVFVLLGGPILGLVYGAYYQSGTLVLVLLSAGKFAAVWSGSCGAVLQFTGHQRSMLWVNLLISPIFIVGALLMVRDYGPIGVASMTAATMILQNVALVLVAKRKTGMWTHVSLSLSPLRKGLLGR